jgi:hypothetical protein
MFTVCVVLAFVGMAAMLAAIAVRALPTAVATHRAGAVLAALAVVGMIVAALAGAGPA